MRPGEKGGLSPSRIQSLPILINNSFLYCQLRGYDSFEDYIYCIEFGKFKQFMKVKQRDHISIVRSPSDGLLASYMLSVFNFIAYLFCWLISSLFAIFFCFSFFCFDDNTSRMFNPKQILNRRVRYFLVIVLRAKLDFSPHTPPKWFRVVDSETPSYCWVNDLNFGQYSLVRKVRNKNLKDCYARECCNVINLSRIVYMLVDHAQRQLFG